MRVAFCLLVALALAAAYVAGQDDDKNDFEDWIARHGRNYTDIEYLKRKAIFAKNKAQQIAHNLKYKAGLKTWKEDFTRFADMTTDEFLKSLGLDNSTASTQTFGTALTVDEAYGTSSKRFGEIDWRAKGKVSGVKNQGSCGSCWTFASSAVVETCVAISTNSNPLDLAEQNYMDCLFSKTCQKGGWPAGALDYAKTHGQAIEKEYPYMMKTGTCHDEPDRAYIGNRVSGKTEADLERMLQNGAVSVSLDATVLQRYSGGVITATTPHSINHAVTVVALTSKCDGHAAQCWVVKNSWGTRWGEQGYFRVAKGINAMGIAQVLDSATNCRYNGKSSSNTDSTTLGHIEQGDRGGGDYTITTASSSADCRSKCSNDTKCAVWAFESCSGGTKCWLKTNKAFDLSAKSCRTSGVIPGRG